MPAWFLHVLDYPQVLSSASSCGFAIEGLSSASSCGFAIEGLFQLYRKNIWSILGLGSLGMLR